MPDKTQSSPLGAFIDTNPEEKKRQVLSPEEVAEITAKIAQSEAVSLVVTERALRETLAVVCDHEEDHPSDQGRLAMLLLQAASLLMRQARTREASRATGKLKNGVKEYLRQHGERFADDNLAKHLRRLVERTEKATALVKAETIQVIKRKADDLREAVRLASALPANERQDAERLLRDATEALSHIEQLVKDAEESPFLAAYFSAQAMCALWEVGGAWLLEKKMKEHGQRLTLPTADALADKFAERFERKHPKKWGSLTEDLLVDAVRLAGADAKSAKKLVREPLKNPGKTP